MKHRASRLVCTLLVATAFACKPRGATQTEATAPATASTLAVLDASAPSSASSAGPPSAYVPPPQKPVAGLLCEGEDGLWRLLPDGNAGPLLAVWQHNAGRDLPPSAPGAIGEGSHGPNGALYISGTPGMMRLGDPLVVTFRFPYEGPDKPNGDSLAFSKSRVAWWGSFELWESAVFPPTRREDFVKVGPPGTRSFKDVVYDGAGRLWVATYDDDLFVREGETWTKADLPAYPLVLGLAVYEGVAHALLKPKLVAYPGAATAPKVVVELPGSAREMRAGKHGVVVLLEPASGQRSGKLVHYDGAAKKTLAGQMDRLIDYDESGLVWGREKEGFLAIDAAGKRTFWPKGSIPGFARQITSKCFVVGHYETLPLVGPVRFGSAKGTITRGGKPLANARLELCEALPRGPFSTKTPCGGDGVSGKTGADGTFVVEKVPIGMYHLVVDLGDKWKGTSTLGSHALPIVAEGFAADYGTLPIE